MSAWFHYIRKSRWWGPWLTALVPGLFLWTRWRGVAGFWRGVLIHPRAWVSDLLVTFWPNAAFLRRAWQQSGHLPQWRPWLFSGSPLVGDPQSGLGYLPNLAHLLLPPTAAFNLLLWAHLTVGVLGMLCLARQAGLRQGRWLAGLGFALFPSLYAHWGLGHVGMVYAAVAAPWALAAALALARGRGRWAGMLALALGTQWVNHPQMALYTALLGGGLAVVAAFEQGGPEGLGLRQRVRRLAWAAAAWTGGNLWGVLVGAVVLLPLLRNLPLLARQALSLQEATQGALSWAGLLGLWLPPYGGDGERLVYLGVLGSALALLGLRRRRTRAWGGLVLLALLYALGGHFPPTAWTLTHLPGLRQVRVPARIWLVAYPLALLLAGVGWESGLNRGTDERVRRALRIAIASLALALGIFVFAYRATFGLWPATPWLAAWGWSTLTWILWTVPRPRAGARPWGGLLILLAFAADLWVMDASLMEVRPLEVFFDRPQLTAFLVRQQAATPTPWRIYTPSYSLPQHVGVRYGLEQANGVDPLYFAAYDLLMQRASGVPRRHYGVTVPAMEGPGPTLLSNRHAGPDAAWLGLLNVRFVLAAYPLRADGLRFVGVMDRVWVYENQAWLPRAFLVGRVLPVAGVEEALERLERLDKATVAVVEGALPLDEGVPQGEVRWLEHTSDTLRLQVTSDRQAWLVLSQTWHPDWRAWVDGVPVPYWRTDGALGGVPIPPGVHEVRLHFTSPAYHWGLWLSLASTLAALGGASWLWWSHRKGGLQCLTGKARHAKILHG